jgi:predicted ester cyclase
MTQTLSEPKVSSATVKNMEAYFNTHDVQYVSEDAVFINMGTGEESKGREAIGEMLHYIYHVAFEAKAEFSNNIITEDKALVEGFFNGKHIGEFAGIPPTGKNVNVPFAVTYDLKNGLIKKARIYMLGDVLMRQLS